MSLIGTWKGSNGSIITLGGSGPNKLVGTYKPTIKSADAYTLIGYQTTSRSTPNADQAVSLAIRWHSLAGPLDTSAHWVSGLTGPLVHHRGTQRLILTHAIVASTDFPGLATAGTYIDKVIYTLVSTEVPEPPPQTSKGNIAVADPIEGRWFSHDGTSLLIQSAIPDSAGVPGQVFGTLNYKGRISDIQGLTDFDASTAGLGLQSVAMVGLLNDSAGPAIALAGVVEIDYKLITLLELQSSLTAALNTHLRTTVSSQVFLKI